MNDAISHRPPRPSPYLILAVLFLTLGAVLLGTMMLVGWTLLLGSSTALLTALALKQAWNRLRSSRPVLLTSVFLAAIWKKMTTRKTTT